jgi:hypothetical protein
MVATRQWPGEHERRLIDGAVAQHINEWATIVGVAPRDACIEPFRDDVTGALYACLKAHFAGSAGDPDKKVSKRVRKQFLAHYKARIKAVKKLREAFAPVWPPSIHEFQVSVDQTLHLRALEALTEAMRLEADDWKHGGGRPPMAFKALAKGLVIAYQRSTERTGVGHGAREGNKLRTLVARVLPVVCDIAMALTGKPLETPATQAAIGEYLHRVASKTQRGA